MTLHTPICDLLGIEHPIFAAGMGGVTMAPLTAAISAAGGCGVLGATFCTPDQLRAEIRSVREITDKPFGVNIAQAFVRDPNIVQFVIDQGIKFVTTSAGSPMKYTADLKAGGLMVFHVVPTLDAALKAVEAGVDGLIVEGGEGGGSGRGGKIRRCCRYAVVRCQGAKGYGESPAGRQWPGIRLEFAD